MTDTISSPVLDLTREQTDAAPTTPTTYTRRGRWIERWEPDDEAFWDGDGGKILPVKERGKTEEPMINRHHICAEPCPGKRAYDGAVLAYLHVPVFYEDEKLWMPPALLGSARAFRGLADLERAKKSLNDLTAQYPKSAQAEVARKELEKSPK